MQSSMVRLVVAGLLTGALGLGPAAAPTHADTACDQATAAYVAAHARFVEAKHDLARAKRQLHQAHAHGTAVVCATHDAQLLAHADERIALERLQP